MNTLLPTTSAESTTESLPVIPATGTSLQPLEQAVAPLLTPLGSECCVNDTVKVITAMCLGLMDQTLSSDSMWMAMRQAEDTAVKAGVTRNVAEDVVKQLGKAWLARRSRNPLSGMF